MISLLEGQSNSVKDVKSQITYTGDFFIVAKKDCR